MKFVCSESMLRRLPRYYRCARALLGQDVLRISSAELADLMGIGPSQIRQDFRLIGGVGQQGYGYNVKDLYSRLGDLMGLNKMKNAVLVCDSRLGDVLLELGLLRVRGVNVRCCFGESVREKGVEERPLEEFDAYCAENDVALLILALDKGKAQRFAEHAAECGVRGVLNLSDCDVRLESVPVENLALSDRLMALSCSMKFREELEKESAEEQGNI